MSGEKLEPSHPAPPIPENQRDCPPSAPIPSPYLQSVPCSPCPVAREGSLGRRTEAATGAERAGVLSSRSSSVARAGQGSTQRKAATDQARGSGVKGAARERGLISGSQAARRAIDPTPIKTSMGPRDGAFDPSAREVPVRVEGVTRTVPGLHAGAACPSWAPGVAAKNGACPELMNNSSRGASSFVETVKPYPLRAKPRRPAQPSTARCKARRASAFLLPLWEKVGRVAGRMRGLATVDEVVVKAGCNPSSVSLRLPPSPARGEG